MARPKSRTAAAPSRESTSNAPGPVLGRVREGGGGGSEDHVGGRVAAIAILIPCSGSNRKRGQTERVLGLVFGGFDRARGVRRSVGPGNLALTPAPIAEHDGAWSREHPSDAPPTSRAVHVAPVPRQAGCVRRNRPNVIAPRRGGGTRPMRTAGARRMGTARVRLRRSGPRLVPRERDSSLGIVK